MSTAPGVVHRLEHSTQPQLSLHGLKHQQTAVEDNLKRPVVEARKGEGHDRKLLGLFTPSPERRQPLLTGLISTCDLGHALLQSSPRFCLGRNL